MKVLVGKPNLRTTNSARRRLGLKALPGPPGTGAALDAEDWEEEGGEGDSDEDSDEEGRFTAEALRSLRLALQAHGPGEPYGQVPSTHLLPISLSEPRSRAVWLWL